MTLQTGFAGLALLLAGVSAILFLLVVFRRGHQLRDLALAIFLLALAIGVWWTSIRTPLPLP